MVNWMALLSGDCIGRDAILNAVGRKACKIAFGLIRSGMSP